jgi:hypothetical protein
MLKLANISRILAFAALCLILAPLGLHADITVGSKDSGNCYPFMCNDSGTSSGPSITYQEAYNPSAFSGPISITSLTFYFWPFAGSSTILGGEYDISLSTATTTYNFLSSTLSSNVGADSQLFNDYTVPAGGANFGSMLTIAGTPFSYDPANGPLLLNVYVTNQDNVPNGSANGYNWADYTGAAVTRAFSVTNGSNSGSVYGALVTTFNATPTPEPSTILILALALAGSFLTIRRLRTDT